MIIVKWVYIYVEFCVVRNYIIKMKATCLRGCIIKENEVNLIILYDID